MSSQYQGATRGKLTHQQSSVNSSQKNITKKVKATERMKKTTNDDNLKDEDNLENKENFENRDNL